ncbi:MAG: ABC transporter substrate-binding protein [Deinococcota bacterium]
MKKVFVLLVLAILGFSYAQETRTVTDDLGREVEVSTNPQSVVFTGGEEHAAMVTSLGYVPLGIGSVYGQDSAETLTAIGGDVGDLSGMIGVGASNELDYETIAALEPDLIIHWSNEEAVERLSLIAPTLGYNPRANNSGEYGDPSGERYLKQRTFASLVGVEDALDVQVAEYQALLAEVKERHADIIPELEWTFIDDSDEAVVYMYDGERFPTFAYHAVLTDIGLTPSTAMVDATAKGIGYEDNFGYAQVSVEVVPDYAADLIFVGRYDTAPIAGPTQLALDSTAAADAGQVHRVNANIWTYHLVQAEIRLLQEIDAILSAGVENVGDFN